MTIWLDYMYLYYQRYMRYMHVVITRLSLQSLLLYKINTFSESNINLHSAIEQIIPNTCISHKCDTGLGAFEHNCIGLKIGGCPIKMKFEVRYLHLHRGIC